MGKATTINVAEMISRFRLINSLPSLLITSTQTLEMLQVPINTSVIYCHIPDKYKQKSCNRYRSPKNTVANKVNRSPPKQQPSPVSKPISGIKRMVLIDGNNVAYR